MGGLSAAVKGGFDEMRVGLDEVKGGLGKVAGEIKVGFDEVKGGFDKMAKSLQDSIMCIKNLQAPNYPYPHLVVVNKVETRGKRGLLAKVRGIAKKDMTMHFLCPVDMSKVPCGDGGEGYGFRETRRWVKKLSPVLQVRQVLLWHLADEKPEALVPVPLFVFNFVLKGI